MASSGTFVALFILFSSTVLTPATNNGTDFLSLLAFKAAIHDPLGPLITSWDANTHFCAWEGIRCSRRHPDRVVAINLKSQGLVGSLSPSVGNMSFLRLLNLQNNTFTGNIPDEVGRLRRLEFVELSNNSFSGAIPKNLSSCSNLVYLNLIRNRLSGAIPHDFHLFRKIEDLGLGFNRDLLGNIPPSFGNLTSLRELYLGECNLIGEIPESFGQLRNLKYIDLGGNKLKGSVPSTLFNISTVSEISASSNQLEGSIPSSIGFTLPNLIALYLGGNQFSGPIPISLSNASSLEDISLTSNNFSGRMPMFGRLARLRIMEVGDNPIQDDINFISSLVNCTNLEILEIGGNQVSGVLPDSIANLSSTLWDLFIQGTQVHGKIPLGIGNLVGLTRLSFSTNNLEGIIPSSIGELSKLQLLKLSKNRFNGELPHSLGNMTSLNRLHLEGNQFHGSIPKSLNSCTSLLHLDLSHNNLNGSIPPEVLNISSISILLDFSYNAFKNSIPSEIHFLTHLANLNLSNNKLSGVITNSLSSCISLVRLHLEGNQFEGEIPQGLSALRGLKDLDLSRNNFSGSIPSFLGKLQLQKLNLSFNGLEGEVPMSGVFANQTMVSVERNEHLCGGIPELKLPPCALHSTSKKKKSMLMKILTPIGVVLFTCLVIFLYKKGKHKMKLPSSPTSIGTQFLRLSYADLVNATGGFSETNLIGVGRFARVYKGILSDGHTWVAVKVLNLLIQGASKSFIAECNALRHMRHRNLLKILSVCESLDFRGNDFKALVYEFKENGSLESWLHGNVESIEGNDGTLSHLSITQRLDISIDIAHALEYLHCGTTSVVVHGDLKPSNILLDRDLTACVGDFGLAKIFSNIIPSHGNSSSIGIKGTIGYIPPEYGMSNMISKQGDVYSYGILLLQIFTNKKPTDNSFGADHTNLYDFVLSTLQDYTMEVADPLIRISHDMNEENVRNCMASLLRIGVACSKENPADRMLITNVVSELHKIKEHYFTKKRVENHLI